MSYLNFLNFNLVRFLFKSQKIKLNYELILEHNSYIDSYLKTCIHNKHIKKKKNSFYNIVNFQPLSKVKYNLIF